MLRTFLGWALTAVWVLDYLVVLLGPLVVVSTPAFLPAFRSLMVPALRSRPEIRPSGSTFGAGSQGMHYLVGVVQVELVEASCSRSSPTSVDSVSGSLVAGVHFRIRTRRRVTHVAYIHSAMVRC